MFYRKDHKPRRVVIEIATSYDGLVEKFSNAFDEFPNFLKQIREARRVLIKPNVMGRHDPSRGRTTHPDFVWALLTTLRKITDAALVVGDGAGPGVHTEEAFEKTGIAAVAKSLDIPIVTFSTAPMSVTRVEGATLFDQLELVADLRDFDVVINVPKLKTTYASPVAGMKNLMGLMSQPYRYMFHSHGLHEGVADLNSVIPTNFVVVDGILGCELRWPINSNVVIMGEDPVAVDVISSEVMTVPVDATPYIKLSEMKGLGTAQPSSIITAGASIDAVRKPFRIPPIDNPASLSNKFADVVNCGACCIGCIGTVQKGLDDIIRDRLAESVRKRATIIVGPNWNPAEFKPESTLLVGNCTASRCRTWPNIVRGAPPLIHKFSEKLLSLLQ